MNTTLKVLFFALFLAPACGGMYKEEEKPVVEPPPPAKKENCRTYARPSKESMTVRVWIDPRNDLSESRVLSALNSYWSEVGFHVVKASSPKQANFGLLYMSTKCKVPVDVGRLNYNEWADLDSIMIDYTCFDKIPGYLDKLPSALSNALGRLMGIEGYQSFCSNGIMNYSIMKMAVPNPPAKLSDGDKKEFYKRTYYFKSTDYETICKPEVVWENGSYTPKKYRQHTFWASPSLSQLPIKDYLNKYFGLFGKNFVQVSDPSLADFALYDWGEEYKGCSPTAIAYKEDKEVFLKYGECIGAGDSLKDATVVVHEVAHLFGMKHVPEWCGNSIMNAQVNPGPNFTSTDVKAWMHREATPLDSQVMQVEKNNLRLTFVSLNLARR